mgnify:CR=1 FL=1
MHYHPPPKPKDSWEKLIQSPKEVSIKNNSYWLDDWALFCSIKSHFNNITWTEWPIELRDRHPKVLDEWRGKTEYKSIILEQTKFQSGWEEIHDFANKKNSKTSYFEAIIFGLSIVLIFTF